MNTASFRYTELIRMNNTLKLGCLRVFLCFTADADRLLCVGYLQNK